MTRLASLLALLLWGSLAMAADWQVDREASTLGFRGQAQGEPFEGRFRRFQAEIRFDPADLANSRFEVSVELASADTANAERDELLHGDEFFASADGALAHYRASRFEALGGDRYRALGELTLKGNHRPVNLEFRWQGDGSAAILAGEATLDRLAFAVGSGDWADPEMIATAVEVNTRLRLTPP